MIALALMAVAADSEGCYAAARALDAGDAVARADIAEVACRSQTAAPLLRHDRQSGAAIARVAIAPGQYLGRVWIPEPLAVERGATVQVIARIGVVEIRREVTALQNARAGQSFFVMDADGDIFVAPPVEPSEGR